jgi:predicted nuclease of predicted toxin-antitoxin system
MRFLVDQNLSPLLAAELRNAGHDVTHTRDLGLSKATDDVSLKHALDEGRVLISADTDFGLLLAESGADRPSFVLLRLRSPASGSSACCAGARQSQRDRRGPGERSGCRARR